MVYHGIEVPMVNWFQILSREVQREAQGQGEEDREFECILHIISLLPTD
jgi:hypothetical protein